MINQFKSRYFTGPDPKYQRVRASVHILFYYASAFTLIQWWFYAGYIMLAMPVIAELVQAWVDPDHEWWPDGVFDMLEETAGVGLAFLFNWALGVL